MKLASSTVAELSHRPVGGRDGQGHHEHQRQEADRDEWPLHDVSGHGSQVHLQVEQQAEIAEMQKLLNG